MCPYTGVENVEADRDSRKSYRDSEWMLNPQLFKEACDFLKFSPSLDCFATRHNTQLPKYVSYKPDPFATHVDAFTVNWNYYNCYIFPPFSLLGQILQKIITDKAEVLLVAPFWPTQPWFNILQNLLVGETFVIRPHANNLFLPNNLQEKHPLVGKLTLIVGILSGKNTSVQAMTRKQ